MMGTCCNAAMSPLGQKRPKLPWLPAGKNTHERMGHIVPGKDFGGSGGRANRALSRESGFGQTG